MKNKYLKRILSAVLVGTMVLCLSACGNKEEKIVIEPMEKEEVHALSFDFIGGKDVMPISGYYGPTNRTYSFDGQSFPDYFTDEIFEMISGCGVNALHYSNTDWNTEKDSVIKMMELGEKHNVGIFVYDAYITSPTPTSHVSLENMSERLTQYSDYPAYCGLYVIDEPGSKDYRPTADQMYDISTYAPVFQNLRKLGVVGSGNLNPIMDAADHDNYLKYVEEYCETCQPYYLSFDYYLWDSHRNRIGYFYNLDINRHYAEKYKIPLWCYIQAGGQWNDGHSNMESVDLYPTDGQLHWNVNTALAYGAKGIEYFTVIQRYWFAFVEQEANKFDFQRNGLIGAWGNKTQWWYYAKEANKQVAAVDAVLMNSVNKGVIATGEKARKETQGCEFVMKDTSWRELESVEGNTLIGCFNYQGKTALYVVNYEEEYAQKVTLNLLDSYNLSVTQNAKLSRINTDKLELDLKAGEGVLVVFD